MIGAEAVAKAPADGYMLLMADSARDRGEPSPLQQGQLQPRAGFCADHVLVAITPLVIAVHPAYPPGTSGSSSALAKAKPGTLASPRPGPAARSTFRPKC